MILCLFVMSSTRSKHLTIDEKSVLDVVKSAINQVVTSDEFIDKIVSSLLNKMKNELQGVLKEAISRIELLEAEKTSLKEEMCSLRMSVDDLEQYSRRQNLRIYGIPEKEAEIPGQLVLSLFDKQLGICLDNSKISRSHRIGKVVAGKHRAIIVKFTNHNDKTAVFNNKSKLKSTKIVIREDLTYKKLQLFKSASQKLGRNNVWTRDGVIFARVNDHTHKIYQDTDLTNF